MSPPQPRAARVEAAPFLAGSRIRPRVVAGGTQLLFTHEGFDPDNEVIPVITPAWAGIIGRLKHYAETGEADPFARN